MDTLNKYFSQIDIVQAGDKIFKDECVFSFDTPESDSGIYICMKNFEAVGADFLTYHYNKHKYSVYLNHKRLKYRITKPESVEAKPKRLAIGVEGGFDPNPSDKDYRYEDSYTLVIMPTHTQIALPNPDLPELYLQSIQSIITAQSSDSRLSETSVWEGEVRRVSKYAANLEQLPINNKIPPSNWKCESCDLKENLWLNLTDGSILCGRRFFDGSGGNNHALEHYDRCKYPLAVKLGTITPESADIYSYPEEDMVLDPHLPEHLAHFGIDIQKLTKTEKSILELEIDMNERIGEWSVIQEEGKNLEPIGGPGFTGLINLGNSCYMNSVLQVLLSLSEFQDRYTPAEIIYGACDCIGQFNFQMAKLAYGVLTGKYSNIKKPKLDDDVHDDDDQTLLKIPDQQSGIAPRTFKHFVCGLNRNFATKRQQDAHEFFLYLTDLIQCNSDKNLPPNVTFNQNIHDPSKCFEVVIEDRIQCLTSNKVKYTQRAESCISLDVDTRLASNYEEAEKYRKAIEDKVQPAPSEVVRPIISLAALIDGFAKPEIIENFYSAAILQHTMAEKFGRIAKYPRVLVFQIKKFQCGENWVPKKLDVFLDVPDILDLEAYMAKGMQADEEQIPETSSGGLTDDSYEQRQQQHTYHQATGPSSDLGSSSSNSNSDIPQQAAERGSTPPASGSATASGSASASASAPGPASAPGLASGSAPGPGPASSESVLGSGIEPTSEAIAMLASMGIDTSQAIIALKMTNNDPQRAIEYIFDPESYVPAPISGGRVESCASNATNRSSSRHANLNLQCEPVKPDEDPKLYQLKAFISHMGPSTISGHYVCHIRREGKWYIYNDEKVAISENPPRQFGYLYFYERISTTPK